MFQAATLLGFALRRFPLPRHERYLSAHPACLALARTDLPTRARQILARLPGAPRKSVVPCLPKERSDSSLPWALFPSRVTLSWRCPALGRTSSHELGSTRASTNRNRLLGVSVAKSLEDLRKDPLSLLGFLHLVPARPGVGAEQVSMTLVSRVLPHPAESKKKVKNT